MSVTAILMVVLLTIPLVCHADSARIELEVAPGAVAEAAYWPGAADRPAVMIVHGFLQTREFPTVRRLAEALADEGYSVLTPTLTLGINRRRQSLACEAIHAHTLAGDVSELRAWVGWLTRRSGKLPTLVGHSTGGVHLTALLDRSDAPLVDRAILVSTSYFDQKQSAEQMQKLLAHAREGVARGDQRVYPYALSYCRRYVSTPAGLLSYLDWDKGRLRAALLRITVPVAMIYGDSDRHVDRAWLDALNQGALTVRAVAGAKHFFDQAYEFDLLGQVLLFMDGADHG